MVEWAALYVRLSMDCLPRFWHTELVPRWCRGRGREPSSSSLRDFPPASEDVHHVHCNQPHLNSALGYPGNETRTTKYTWYDFLPKSLFEQYRRAAYWYFTAMAALSLTPFSPYSSISVILPLAFVLALGMGRELWEDWRRAQGDKQVNSRSVLVVSPDSTMVTKEWKDLRVGDVVKVEDNDYFPADLLLLSSSLEQGSCYVETRNLDGETNLKVRQALDCTLSLRDLAQVAHFTAHLTCDAPNASLYTFSGVLDLPDGPSLSVGPQQILLRDSTLQNTGYVCGVVIYTGHDTKVMQNATPPPSKRSRIDLSLDKVIWVMFFVLFILSFITGLVFGIITQVYGPHMLYLRPGVSDPYFNPNRAAVAGIVSFVTSLVLYGYLVPIALYVTLEIVRVLQALFIMQDLLMYDEDSGRAAKVKSAGLNEELGQVDTILSDKTGTLTRNQMDFFRCTIAGVTYGTGTTEVERAAEELGLNINKEGISAALVQPTRKYQDVDPQLTEDTPRVRGFNFHDSRILGGNWVKEENANIIQFFFEVLALCHTAIPQGDVEDMSSITYRAESPDEAALVVAAKQFGFCFYKRTSTSLHIREVLSDSNGGDKSYELLNILEFSSTRKRMSVIVRLPDGKLILLCKGADSVMLERIHPTANGWVKETIDHLRQFGEVGLRTLLVAYREVEVEEYEQWNKLYIAAKNVVGGERETRVEEVEEEIEKGLIVIGGTGVEDKLQVGVPDTIDRLAHAGIKIWMLTGDKVETAINIGYACSLLRKGMEKIIVSLDSGEARCINEGFSREEATQRLKDLVGTRLREGLQSLEESKSDDEGGSSNWGRRMHQLQSKVSLRSNSVGSSRRRSLNANGLEVEDDMEQSLSQRVSVGEPEAWSAGPASHALVIDGQSLALILGDEGLQRGFLQLCLQCSSVLCCRVSPRQKAQVTQLVRKGLGQNKLCLAIGDGANDVGMIQAANVGVGIAGVEGAQAAMAADYAIGQFRFLQRLLLVHGHWCYRRISIVILYFFYKVCIMGWVAVYSNMFSFMSGQPLYNSWYASFYNTVFTALPIGVVGVMDQDASAQELIRHPELYRTGQRKLYFNSRLLVLYIANSVWASFVIFFFPVGLVWARAVRQQGQVADLQDFGVFMFTGLVLVPNLQLAASIHYFTWIHHLALWGSIASWYLFLLVYGSFPPRLSTTAYQEFVEVAGPSASFWLLSLLHVFSALWPYLATRSIMARFFPSRVQIVREANGSR